MTRHVRHHGCVEKRPIALPRLAGITQRWRSVSQPAHVTGAFRGLCSIAGRAAGRAPVLAEVKRTVAQDRPRSCARTSSLKVTWELLVLLGTVSHLLITITQARPSSAITSASLQQEDHSGDALSVTGLRI